jgi:hypothetical protein
MKKTITFLALTIIAVSSCTDASRSKIGGYGDTYKVIVIGGDTTMVFHSTGKVLSEDKTDGYYFTNEANGKLVEVSGNVIIEQE